MADPVFRSRLSTDLETFVSQKRAAGYPYLTSAKVLGYLDTMIVKQHKERCGDCAVAADYNLHIERITLTACSRKQRAFFLLTTQKVV